MTANRICTALTHLVTPANEPSYYCCVNAGVAKQHLWGLPECRDLCECHEKGEDWRPTQG